MYMFQKDIIVGKRENRDLPFDCLSPNEESDMENTLFIRTRLCKIMETFKAAKLLNYND